MNLVEKHIIKRNNIFFDELDNMCFLSKNVYNFILYTWRQSYIIKNVNLSQKQVYAILKNSKYYKSLPQNIIGQIFLLAFQNINSSFKAMESYNKNAEQFTSKPQLPKYKDNTKGRCIITYVHQNLPKKKYEKDGLLRFTKLNITLKSKILRENIKRINIIPMNNQYCIDVIYEREEKLKIENDNISGIDLGLNNLATVSFNKKENKPFIINGKPLKSINQFYNKQKAIKQLKLTEGIYNSNEIIKLTNKRNNKINDYLHKASRVLVNQLVSKNISKLIIGKNDNWKQDINIGKKNNQNFVNIPHTKFIEMITYKARLEGIEVILTEESYTSKCSFIDNEEMKHKENYLGTRKGKTFITKNGKRINADLNGSLNIIRKVVPNTFNYIDCNGIEDLVISPMVYTIK